MSSTPKKREKEEIPEDNMEDSIKVAFKLLTYFLNPLLCARLGPTFPMPDKFEP